jgi:Xaa-Pro dipeptidase
MSDLPSLAASLAETFGPHLATVSERAARALEACGHSGLLVHSGSPLRVFEDDRSYPFEVHAPFKVWVPLAAPDSFVYFEPGRRPQLLLHRPEDFWHKPVEVPEAYWTGHFDISLIPTVEAARAFLPADLSNVAYVGDALPELTPWGTGAINPSRLMRHLDYGRAVKTPYEIACLREASRLGALGHRAAAAAFAAGASELAIELMFIAACGQREQDLPYSPIIALNEGGATLHYQLLERVPRAEARSLLIDAGVEFGGYASDITRTSTFPDRYGEFAALIGLMERMQQRLCGEVRAGVDWADVHLRAHELTGEVLREADLIRCSAAEAVQRGLTRVFFPHGIGHLLGLEVHDVGGFMRGPDEGDIPRPEGHPFLRLTRVLQPGFVVTMEPGIYFIESLLREARADERGGLIQWPRVDDLRPFGGIRIEDDLVVTAAGSENLTREAFARLPS